MSKFRADLAVGEMAEAGFRALLSDAGLANNKPNERSNDVRFELGGVWRTAEVKFDIYAAKSGNLALEYRNTRSGKPTGILASRSDFWVVGLGTRSSLDELWVAPTSLVRHYFLWSDRAVRDVKGAGDGNADIRLFPKDDILSVFERVDTVDPLSLALTLIDCYCKMDSIELALA